MINFRDVTEARNAERKIKEQIERLTALRELDQLIASTLDLRLGMEILLSRAVQLLAVDAAAILLLDPVQNVLRYGASIGFRTNALQDVSVPLGQSLAGIVALDRKTIQIQNAINEFGNQLLAISSEDEAFLSYYGAPLIAKGKLLGVLELFGRTSVEHDQDWLDFFHALAGQAAIMVDDARLFNELQQSNMELSVAYDATIEGWSRALDLRDKETEGHTQRVTELAMRLAQQMGFPAEELIQIRRGALLHDIGKLGVPGLYPSETRAIDGLGMADMKQHPVFAYELLNPIRYLKSAALEIPYCHHEKVGWYGLSPWIESKRNPVGGPRVFHSRRLGCAHQRPPLPSCLGSG